jgi:dolichyl-phosphate-mannose--protein O-mannosyl transferase
MSIKTWLENKSVILLVLLALVLRYVAGPSWGLPFRYDPDEGFFIQPAIDMYRSKNYNPNWFGHPGSTIIYINMVAYILLSKSYIIFTELSTKGEVWEYLKTEPTSLFFLMRSIQVLIGGATVFMVYLVGKKISNHRVGVVAGLMVAMVPLMIHYSQIVRTDMLAALLMLFVVYKSIQIQESEKISNYVYASLGIAAAIATKYPAGLISLYLAWCHFPE